MSDQSPVATPQTTTTEPSTPAAEPKVEKVDLTQFLPKEEQPEVKAEPAKEKQEDKKDEKVENPEKPQSKEWAAFNKRDKELRAEKENLKKEKAELEAERESIKKKSERLNDLETKIEMAKKDPIQGIKLLEELTNVEWDTYVTWLAEGATGDNPFSAAAKKKQEEEAKNKEAQEYQELTTKQRNQVKQGLINLITDRKAEFELIGLKPKKIQEVAEDVLSKIEEYGDKNEEVPNDETILKWIQEAELEAEKELELIKSTSKAKKYFTTPNGDEVKKVNQPPAESEQKREKVVLSQEDSLEVPKGQEVDINNLPWEEQIKHLTSMLKRKE